MFSKFSLIAAVLAFSQRAHADVMNAIRETSATVPPFDGQYLPANSSNTDLEWWYAQALAEPVGDNPPVSVVAVFGLGPFDGFFPVSIQGGSEWWVDLSGTFANGTNFAYTLNANSTATITVWGQQVNANFPGAGSFVTDSSLTSWVATIDAPGITGTITLESNGAPHYPCGLPDATLSSIEPASGLSSSEQEFYTQFGWVVTMTGGSATVDLNLYGTPLQFTGNAYHDHNFLPTTVNELFNYWYWVQAQVGPYDLTGMLLQPYLSSRTAIASYLYDNSAQDLLQNQCSNTLTASNIVPWGQNTDPGTGLPVPAGFTVSYTLEDGSEYSFNLTALVVNPDSAFYYRWMGTATGGKVGGQQYNGTALFEWMNPILKTY